MIETNHPNDGEEPSNETAAKFRRLRALKSDLRLKCNKNDAAITMIDACLDEGFDTRPRIVGVLGKIGLNARHIAMTLNHGTGADPARHRWQVDQNGHYKPHDEAPTA